MRRIVYFFIIICEYITCFIKKEGVEIHPANCLMKVLSVLSSIMGNAYPCMSEFCPL